MVSNVFAPVLATKQCSVLVNWQLAVNSTAVHFAWHAARFTSVKQQVGQIDPSLFQTDI